MGDVTWVVVRDLIVICERQGQEQGLLISATSSELLDSKDKNQRSMLSRASELGHLKVLDEIIIHVQPHTLLELDQLGRHSAHWSAARGRHEVLKCLIQHVSSSQLKINKGAKTTGDNVDRLLDHLLWKLLFLPDSNGQTLIQLAAYNGHLEAVKVILGAMQSFAFQGIIMGPLSSASHQSTMSPTVIHPSHLTGRGGGQGLSSAGSTVAEGYSNAHFLPLNSNGRQDHISEAFEWMAERANESSQEDHDFLISELKAACRIYEDSLKSSLQLCRQRKYVSVYRAILAAQNAIGISDQ